MIEADFQHIYGMNLKNEVTSISWRRFLTLMLALTAYEDSVFAAQRRASIDAAKENGVEEEFIPRDVQQVLTGDEAVQGVLEAFGM